MIHELIGKTGHFLVITAFATSLGSAISYFILANQRSIGKDINLARSLYGMHLVAVLGVVAVLFSIINRHYFEYHYAFSHSSHLLPVHFQISCFWEGQEGSFLLWIFWNSILGLILILTNKFWEAPVMAIFALVQAFLLSMILGIMDPIAEVIKIGSSPFILLRDALDAPIFESNPDFIPEDGRGLNILLQNYWMVIHPPTLFLGFATTLIPFTFCLAGIWKGRFTEWVRPALPWTIFSSLILGIGILMGAYWAYETLNFGGYWNWDPVENAVYVPWLVQIAALHTMISYKKSEVALKSAIILVVAVFILILYSTFLTRSGILGNSSVHSFTDLGLSGQLLLYLLFFTALTIVILVSKWKSLPASSEEVSTYSREFWIFLGAIVLCLMAFQIIIPTSIPVFNSILESIGLESEMAPPVDQMDFYSKFQIWFAMALAILTGIGQFFWWKKVDRQKVWQNISKPLILSLLFTAVVFFLGDFHDYRYMLLLTTSIFTVVANSFVLVPLLKSSYKLSGGSMAHIGVGLMLIGILFSSGYSEVISLNNTGRVWSSELPDEINQKNLLLFLNEPRQMGEYKITYLGKREKFREIDGYVNTDRFELTGNQLTRVSKQDFNEYNVRRGDTLTLMDAGKQYFEVTLEKEGKLFRLFPTVQSDENKEMVVYSPDINHTLASDLYAHVRTFPDPDQEEKWSEPEDKEVMIGENFFINDYVAKLENVERIDNVDGVKFAGSDVAVKALIKVLGPLGEVLLEPIFLIKDQMVGRIPDQSADLASKVTLLNIKPESNKFVLGINTTQKEWIILEAVKKPLINLLWIGTIIVVFGFSMALHRRYTEFVKMRNKGLE